MMCTLVLKFGINYHIQSINLTHYWADVFHFLSSVQARNLRISVKIWVTLLKMSYLRHYCIYLDEIKSKMMRNDSRFNVTHQKLASWEWNFHWSTNTNNFTREINFWWLSPCTHSIITHHFSYYLAAKVLREKVVLAKVHMAENTAIGALSSLFNQGSKFSHLAISQILTWGDTRKIAQL